MGWFLSRTKAAVPKRKKKATVGERPQWDPRRTLVALKALASGCLLAGLALGWHWSEHQLGDSVRQRAAQPVASDQVQLLGAPAWMGAMVREEIVALVAAQVSPDPLDRAGIARAAHVLAGNPWVQDVEQIWRLPGGEVAVSAKFRQPMAVVEGRDGFHLVDGQGVRLPGLYLKHQASQLPLPLIVGVRASSHAVGELWPGEDLQAGLALVRLVGHEPYAHQIRAVDVSSRDSRGRIRLLLRTEKGVVVWGLPPNQEQAIEPPASQKKQWLAGVYRQRGAIDAGGRRVDLFGAAPFVHPLTNADAEVQIGYTWNE
jgi:hypothetical protein